MMACRLCVLIFSLLLFVQLPVQAQPSARPAAPEVFAQGLAAWEAARWDEAAAHFRNAVAADPAFMAPEHGAAAYWLGRALLKADSVRAALGVWEEGVRTLAEKGILDVHMADAFVREVYHRQQRKWYAPAAQAYLWMLQSLDAQLAPPQRAVLDRHLKTLRFILPPDVRRRSGLDAFTEESVDAPPLPPDAGAVLVAWWRSQDLLPATPQHERLQEHLERVAYAEAHYRKDHRMDDRARIYIRLGPPDRAVEVAFDSPEFLNKVVFRQYNVSSFSFPENEFWVYNSIDQSAYYLFIADQGYYEIGAPNDLLPSEISHGLVHSERGIRKAQALIRTMEQVYRDLALYHDDFAIRYADVADYAELLDQQEILSQAEEDRAAMQSGQQAPRDLSGAARQPIRTDLFPNDELPHVFAQEMMGRADYEDGLARMRREEVVPVAHTDVLEDVSALPVVVRTARFLDDDGTTRTEVAWGLAPGALEPTGRGEERMEDAGFEHPAPYLLTVTVAQRSEAYLNRVLNVNRHLVRQAVSADAARALEPQQYTLTGDRGTYHLVLQWDQQVAVIDEETGQPYRLGPTVQRNMFRADSLEALDGSGRSLEMSDPMPLLLDEADGEVVIDLERATPYPFRRVTHALPLALYFELYHLTFGADDQTQYTVEYEVRRQGRGGMLSFLGRGGDDEATSARTSYSGTTRTAKELMMIDLSEWDGEGDLQVTLRVTDEVTGEQVARTLDLELVEAR